MFHVNVKSDMLTCKYFDKYMKDYDIHGKIINLSSVWGIRAIGNGGGGNVGYCITKAYASDLRPNIQVNAIGPPLPTPYDGGLTAIG